MKLILNLILLILLAEIVSAQTTPLTIQTQYVSSSIPTVSTPINYIIHYLDNDQVVKGTILLDESGMFKIDAKSGFVDLTLSIDDSITQGYDFFGQNSFFVNQTNTVFVVVFPVGSARVMVVDEKERPIKAPVRIDCSRSNGVQGYFTTDDFGVVEADFLPVGNCVFRSAIENIVISKSIEISQGSKQEVVLKLDGYDKNENSFSWIIIIVIIIIIAIVFLLFFKNIFKKENGQESKIKKKDEDTIETISTTSSSAKEDIMTALNNKEKQVAKFLLEEQLSAEKEGKSIEKFYVSQATLVRGADIPKTSLTRVLESLTQKNIIVVEKIGKLKKISLTDWFNSK